MAVMVMHRCEYDVNLSLWLSWINRLTHFCIVKPEALGTDIKTNKKVIDQPYISKSVKKYKIILQ